MRDGTILRANVYRPAGEGRWPVLLTRLPYGKDLPIGSSMLDPVQAARRGYVVVVQDTRGRFASEGDWEPMHHEAEDGVDTVAWAAELTYSDGQVGMFGASYYGFTQWSAAVQQPPALKAMVPFITWCEPLNGVIFRGGALELGTMANWNLQMGLDLLLRRHRGDPAGRAMALRQLVREIDRLGVSGYADTPLRDFPSLKEQDVAPHFFEAFEHPMDREQTDHMRIAGKQSRARVPTLNAGGWYDLFLQDTIANYRATVAAGQTARLLIGPWSHGQHLNPIGELNFGFGAQAAFIDLRSDFQRVQLRWFDHWLKGLDTGLLQEPPIKLFVMGANVWRDEWEWPPAGAREAEYFLHEGGELSPKPPGGERPDSFDYDAANPVPTRGGALLMSPEYRSGPFDQRPIEARSDVLSYTTPPLEHDVEATGPVHVRLWAASSAPDTDFVARLVDVHPDGYAQNLTDGIVRARYRDFGRGTPPSLIEPGRPYEFEIDLWATSNLFRRGHRIRVDVTSSSFPRWDRNPNTGHDLGADAELAVAHQTVFHDREHPSRLVLCLVG